MSSLRRTITHPSARALAAAGVAVGALTTAAALLSWWSAAVIGLVVLDLLILAAVIRRPTAGRAPVSKAVKTVKTSSPATGAAPATADLERRIDALSARVVAVSERTRIDVLEALSTGRRAPADHE